MLRRLESEGQVFTKFSKLLRGNVMCWGCCIQWLKVILITELSSVSGFKRRQIRMYSQMTWPFSLMRQCSSSVVQWNDSSARIGYQDLQSGMVSSESSVGSHFFEGEFLALCTSTCLRYSLCPRLISCMEMRKFSTNKPGNPLITIIPGPIWMIISQTSRYDTWSAEYLQIHLT